MKPGHVILITIVAYVLWEIIAHTWLMVLPMPLWHLVSGSVGMMLALLITLIAVRTIFAQERQLEAVLLLKDNLTQLLIHDLRAPLMASQSALEMVGCSLGTKAPPELRETVVLAQDSNRDLVYMVDDLRDIARLEEDMLMLEPRETDVTGLVQEAVDAITPMASASGTTIAAEIAPDLATAKMDPDRMRRVLVNLLTNAVKFSHSGGWITLRAQKTQKGRSLSLSVTDSGERIPAEHRKDIFSKFYRVKTQQGDRTTGISLSLVYCRLIAEAHKGTIRLEDAEGKGSTFTVEIPA